MLRLLTLAFALSSSLAAFGQTPPKSAPNPSFNLVNHASQPIRELFATPAGRATFGQNRLTAGPLAPGAKFAVRTVADGNCIFDIRVIYQDNSQEDRRSVNTCAADDVVMGAGKSTKTADDPSFRLLNRGSQPITELFATPAGKPRGANLLADSAIAPQAKFEANLPRGGCSYDLRVVFADKTAKERKAADLCKLTELPVP